MQTEDEGEGAYWFGPVRGSVCPSMRLIRKQARDVKDICYTDLMVPLKRKSTLNIAFWKFLSVL